MVPPYLSNGLYRYPLSSLAHGSSGSPAMAGGLKNVWVFFFPCHLGILWWKEGHFEKIFGTQPKPKLSFEVKKGTWKLVMKLTPICSLCAAVSGILLHINCMTKIRTRIPAHLACEATNGTPAINNLNLKPSSEVVSFQEVRCTRINNSYMSWNIRA